MNDSPDTKKTPELQELEKMNNVFYDYFEQLLDDCCDRLDIEFSIQLGSKREQINKQLYTSLLERLKNSGSVIKVNYLQGVKDLFTPNKTQQHKTQQQEQKQQVGNLSISLGASLVADDAVEEDYTIAMMTKTANNLYTAELEMLSNKLAQLQGRKNLANEEISICPANLVAVLVEVIKSLDFTVNYRIILYQAFDDKVISKLANIYKILGEDISNSPNTQIKAKPKPENQPSSASLDVNNTDHQSFKSLQADLSKWRSKDASSAYRLIPRSGQQTLEQDEIISTLGIIHQLTNYSSLNDRDYKPVKWLMIEKFNKPRRKDEHKHLAQADEDTLDIISLLFKGIKDNDLINKELKTSLLKLQFPLTELALNEPDFIGDSKGTGRKLLDLLYNAALFLNSSNEGACAIKEPIDELIDKICADSHCGIDEIAILVKKFASAMQRSKQCSQIFQKRATDLVKNKEAVESSKNIIDQKINYYIQDREIPLFISDFLYTTWKDFLLLVFLNKDKHSKSWEKSLNITQHLILSVTPTKDKAQRKEMIDSLPTLFKGLYSGLKRISFEKKLQAQFFKNLGAYHDELWMNKKSNLSSSKKQSKQSFDESGKEKSAHAIKDPVYFQIRTLQLKQWIQVKTHSGRRWGQLAWQNTETEQFLFVDKNGNKFLEISFTDLVKLFKKGQAKTVSTPTLPFTQQILSNL